MGWIKKLGLLCLCGWLFLSACERSTVSPSPMIRPALPSLTQTVSVPTLGPTRTPIPITANSDIFQACPNQEQAKSLRANQNIPWQALGLSACYVLELALDDGSQAITGTESLIYTNNTGSVLSEIVFRLYPNSRNNYNGRLAIQSSSIDGQAVSAEVFLEDQTGLRLPLPAPLQPGKTTLVELAFSILPPEDLGAPTAYGIFNRSSAGPVLTLANWYPILAVWQDGRWQASPVLLEGDAVTSASALYRVSIAAPKEWQFVTTGTQVEETFQGERARRVFVSGPARDFMIVASPAFESRTTNFNGVTIRQWGLPRTQNGWDTALKIAEESLEYFDVQYGAYPFSELDIVAGPLQNASGVEYPGLILIINSAYQGSQFPFFLEVVLAHEIAHQWWYSVIGNDVLKHPWQDEGLTTFSTLAFLQEYDPKISDQFLRDYPRRVSEIEKEYGEIGIASPLNAFQNRPSAYAPIVYQKSALFFQALRQQIGEEAFQKALRTYYERHRFQLVPPQTLLSEFTQACACDLSSLYQKWGAQPTP